MTLITLAKTDGNVADYILGTIVPEMRSAASVYEHVFVAGQSHNGYINALIPFRETLDPMGKWDSLVGKLYVCHLSACFVHKSPDKLPDFKDGHRTGNNLRWLLDEVGMSLIEGNMDLDDFWAFHIGWKEIYIKTTLNDGGIDDPEEINMSLAEFVGTILNDGREWTPLRICDWLQCRAENDPEIFSWYGRS